MVRSLRRFLTAGLFVALTPLGARAVQTWIVDDDPGGDFTTIQEAIDAAEPGDRILVQPGYYDNYFVVDKGVTIVGYSPARVGKALVTGIPAGDVAALVNLKFAAFVQVASSQGTVVLQELDPDEIHVTDSEDVRCHLITELDVYNSNSVRNSRLELVESILRGTTGSFAGCSMPFSCWPTQGGAALSVRDQSRVHLVRTDFLGGSSSWLNCEWTRGPDGAPGIYAIDSSEVILTGDQHIARGGEGGVNCFYSQDCSYHGSAASGVFVSGELWHSGMKFEPGSTWSGPNCTLQQEPPVAGSTVHALAERDPTLSLEGTPAAGTTVKFVIRGPAGADVLLFLGRKPIVLPTPGVRVELLTPMNVRWPLGVISATKLERSYKIRPLPPGYTFYAQAELTYPSGEVRRSNSMPIVVR